MKGRRRRRREYCKFALLLVLYTLVLLLVPSVLDGGRDGDKGAGHCPGLQRSLGVWSLEAAAAGEREQGAKARPAADGGAGVSPRSPLNLQGAVGEAVSREKQHIYVHARWRLPAPQLCACWLTLAAEKTATPSRPRTRRRRWRWRLTAPRRTTPVHPGWIRVSHHEPGHSACCPSTGDATAWRQSITLSETTA